MKIILAISTRNNRILSIDKSLGALGCEVSLLMMDDYTNQSSYIEKKLDDWGFYGSRRQFEGQRKMKLISMVNQQDYDLILWINSPAGVLNLEEFSAIGKKMPQIIWFVDGVSGHEDIMPYSKQADRVGCFEYRDVSYLKEYGIHNIMYCPIGYSEAYEHVKASCRDIDIVFVGSPFKNRLRLLEAVAKESCRRNWRFEIYGPFWESRYFWKKLIFRYKYPSIYKFVHNGSLLPEKVAEIYSRSKICLNIHDEKHKSPNPRFFEIIKSGAMQLCDARGNYVGNLFPKKALDVFSDEKSLISMIQYYLENESKRRILAEYGKNNVLYSMRYSLHCLLEGIIDF